jgi:hypothetical protein
VVIFSRAPPSPNQCSGAEPWYPTLRQEREGWATRAFGWDGKEKKTDL